MKMINITRWISVTVIVLFFASSLRAQAHWEPLPFSFNPVGINFIQSMAKVGNTVYFGGYFIATDVFTYFASDIAAFRDEKIVSINYADPFNKNDQVTGLINFRGVLYLNGETSKMGPRFSFSYLNADTVVATAFTAGKLVEMATDDKFLYLSGDISAKATAPDTGEIKGLMAWDGENAYAMGDGLEGTINTLTARNEIVYAGGRITGSGAKKFKGIAMWDGNQWSSITPNETSDTLAIYELLATKNGLYASGNFSSINGVPANHIAVYRNNTWYPLAEGIDESVLSIVEVGDHIYVGGPFIESGGVDYGQVAMWDGIKWSKLNGGGIEGLVTNLLFDGKYLWVGGVIVRIEGVDQYGGVARYLIPTVDVEEQNAPEHYTLLQNYPNPFNPSTTIEYSIATESIVQLKVFSMLGEEVATLVDEVKQPGTYYSNFDASGLPSGMYIYTLKAGSYSESKKLLLVK